MNTLELHFQKKKKSNTLITVDLLTGIIIQGCSVCLLFCGHWDIMERLLNKNPLFHRELSALSCLC